MVRAALTESGFLTLVKFRNHVPKYRGDLWMDLPVVEIVVSAPSGVICTPVAVQAATGPILCAEGRRITLAGIAARSVDDACSADTCNNVSGIAARAALVQLVGEPNGSWSPGRVKVNGAPLVCRPGAAAERATDMWCHDGEKQINCEMVRLGYALLRREGWLGEAQRAGACRPKPDQRAGTTLAMRTGG
jgi:endonuclease YncB( thermonuclease family)